MVRQQAPAYRAPPDYVPMELKSPERPPEKPVGPLKLPFLEPATETNYRDCVGEFQTVLSALKPPSRQSSREEQRPPTPPPKKHSLSRETSLDQSIGIPIVASPMMNAPIMGSPMHYSPLSKVELIRSSSRDEDKENENGEKNRIGGYVKETTQIFNRKASEEAKIPSPMGKGLRKDQDLKVSSIF